MHFQQKFSVILFSFLAAGLFFSSVAQAASSEVTIRDGKQYAASLVSQVPKGDIILAPGEKKTVTLTIKNTGTATWDATKDRYISAYTMSPREHASVFKTTSWLTAKQTAKIPGTVKSGKTGTLTIEVKAPEKIGTYTESFHLSAEGYSWLKDGDFALHIQVKQKNSSTGEVISPKIVPTPSVVEPVVYKAKKLGQTVQEISVPGGQKVQLTVLFQNTGKNPWKEYGFLVNSPTALASVTQLSFADENWVGPSLALHRNIPVSVGGSIREDVSFRAPTESGTYIANFALQADGATVPDANASVTVHVTDNAQNVSVIVPEARPAELPAPQPRLTEEPHIRVGLWKPETAVVVTSDEDDYRVFIGDEEQGVLPKGQKATLGLTNGNYVFQSDDLVFSTSTFIRLVPVNDPHAVFVLLNYDRKQSGKGKTNFNKYRGGLEYRFTQDGKTVYIINDLLFEDYVAGIAETSDGSNGDYVRALLTAARTYAYYIQQHTGKHDKRNFDVVATTGDQLYLGYNSEVQMPRVAAAARDTRGQVVTYNGDIVITPYYGNSDGKTRSWKQVWGGSEKPWLVSVPAQYDKGRKMFGHGVGMSARDASLRAEKEGVVWQDLLKYYYSGTEVSLLYR